MASIPSNLDLSELLIKPDSDVVAFPYFVSVNTASAGTDLAIVNPLSFITLPVLPSKIATFLSVGVAPLKDTFAFQLDLSVLLTNCLSVDSVIIEASCFSGCV